MAGDRVVLGAIAQTHQQFLRRIVYHGRGGRGRHQRSGRIGDIGHEDPVPIRRARSRAHILYVENAIAKVFVENARLNLVRSLRRLECLLQIEDRLVGARRHVERIHQPQQRTADGHDRGDPHEVADAHARGAHGDDLAIRGQAAETQQNPHQHGHGNRDFERIGHCQKENLQHVCPCGAVAHHHLKDVVEIAHEENEGEDHAADQRVREDFAEDVTGQDAHKWALDLVYRACAPGSGIGCQRRKRRLFMSTLTELRAMAAAATQGLSRI